MNREHEIVKASIFGIAGNMVLVIFKLIIGFTSHSIAIVLDGVNNATDAVSSIVTIVGTKLAGKKPDKKHPFGYGRIEYLTSVIIAVIILVAGFISLRESIMKIIHPGTPSYSTIAIIVIVVAIIAKVGIGIMFKRYGDKTNSEALVASGIDSNYDAVLSAGTLVVAFAQNIWNLNIDGIVGLLISLVVCKAGFEVLRDALSPIIGTPEDKALVSKMEEYAMTFPEVHGAYDVVLDNFGPNKIIGSMLVEIPDDMSVRQAATLTRQIAEGLQKETGVVAMVGIHAANTTGKFAPMKKDLEKIVNEHPDILQCHAFFVDEDTKTCYFDLVVKFKVDNEGVKNSAIDEMKKLYPEYNYDVQIDTDFEE